MPRLREQTVEAHGVVDLFELPRELVNVVADRCKSTVHVGGFRRGGGGAVAHGRGKIVDLVVGAAAGHIVGEIRAAGLPAGTACTEEAQLSRGSGGAYLGCRIGIIG